LDVDCMETHKTERRSLCKELQPSFRRDFLFSLISEKGVGDCGPRLLLTIEGKDHGLSRGCVESEP